MKPGDPKAVQKLFDSVAPSYDLLNDLLSFGLHRVWKKQLLLWLAPTAGEQWLDLCCGTGDLAFALARKIRPGGRVYGVDSAQQPLDLARKRGIEESCPDIYWLKKDALNTGLPPCAFDGAVMAYGLRNLTDPLAGFKEIHRLLKPGSRAGVLDFSHCPEGSKRALFQRFYLRKIVVPIAATIGYREQYEYLEKSLRNFPIGSVQEELALEVGFRTAAYRSLAAGQMGALILNT